MNYVSYIHRVIHCIASLQGLLLCFVLRYDAYKKAQLMSAEAGVPPPSQLNRISYFHCSLIGRLEMRTEVYK